MVSQYEMYTSALMSSAVFNLALASIFMYLRLHTPDENLTKSQKWTLTILFWIFALNGFHLVLDSLYNYYIDVSDYSMSFFLSRATYSADIIIAFLLLMFGIIFPRPYSSWKNIERYFMVIFIIASVIIGFMTAINQWGSMESDIFMDFSGALYVMGWFVPIFIWFPDYKNQTSVQGRMISTILIWGLLAGPFAQGLSNSIQSASQDEELSFYVLIMVILSLYMIIRITISLIARRKTWSIAESIHVAFIIIYTLLPVIYCSHLILSYEGESTILSFNENDFIGMIMGFSVGAGTWAFLRPSLFAYGMLRYQLFGSQLRGQNLISLALTVSIAFFFGTAATILSIDVVGWQMAYGVGLVIGLVSFYPMRILVEYAIVRLFPMIGGFEKATTFDRRATYLIGLQTAVVNGRIDDPDDKVAIQKLQKDLAISQREHDLLMESHGLRAPYESTENEFTELFLILSDGRLISHHSQDPSLEQDKDIMAGMLVAIRGFVEEGLKGEQTALDSIRYGDFSLGIETDKNLVLAGLKKGNLSAEDRQRLRDAISSIWERFGPILETWDGTLDSLKGIDKDLIALTKTAPSKV